MIKIIFKNLERSELAKDAVWERLEPLVQKFPDLEGCPLHVTLEMQNSPLQAGPDRFTVKVRVASGRYKGLTLAKTDASLYRALAEVAEHMLEALNRFGDKHRVNARAQQREFAAERIQLAIVDE